MCMLLNRLVKRDSTRPTYSSDHANLLTLLFIKDLTKGRNYNSSGLSNISLKLGLYSIKNCLTSIFRYNPRSMLRHSA